MKNKDFIFGVQYYRAPTPSRENWETDLANIKNNGFSDVKFWIQWRWTHRGENNYYFEDIDSLMDIAQKDKLRVTLNVIFDTAPKWVMDKYSDSKIVLASGKEVISRAVGHRQIGGFPGVCYSHTDALILRKKFLEEVVERYKNHPALYMWDVWNEPEQCGTNRYPKVDELSCYCDNCRSNFVCWLKEKYVTIEKLNDVWGRCYTSFEDIELPRDRYTFSDFIDFREFNLNKMTKEANWRIDLVKSIDNKHPVYLHVVPNTSSIFNALTGVDDFEIAKKCDVFASTNFASPIWSVLTTSAGNGKTCYNVECHIGNGNTKMHQKQISLTDMVKDLVPQIGMGIKGFMFWQYRPEILGHESPAWGTTNLDGTIGSVGIAAQVFRGIIDPYLNDIMDSPQPISEIAVWKGIKNEILSFCIDGDLDGFAKSIDAYVDTVYNCNYNCCIVNDKMIIAGLSGVKLLILPYCYGLDEKLAKAIDKFVFNGGTVLCEAHLGGYNMDSGRHSYRMPGLGLDELWKISELYTTSSYHLQTTFEDKIDDSAFVDDVKKALTVYGTSGGKHFYIKSSFGFDLIASDRYAQLNENCDEIIGTFINRPCIVKQKRGKGTIYYCGSNLGESARLNTDSFAKFIDCIIQSAGVKKNALIDRAGVHIDRLSDKILVVNNNTDKDVSFELDNKYKMLFLNGEVNGQTCRINAGCADILVKATY